MRHRPKASEAAAKDEELGGASTHQESQPSSQAVVQPERFIMLQHVPQVPYWCHTVNVFAQLFSSVKASACHACRNHPLYSFSDSDTSVAERADMQELYGRVRLCNAMVQDHFMPAYLSALDSARGNVALTRSLMAS